VAAYGIGGMGAHADGDSIDTINLLRRAGDGDQEAVARLFARHRERLQQMVRLRMDRRLQGRIDASDVLQETYVEAARRVREFARERGTTVYLWLRVLTGQKLVDLTRQHLGAKMRSAGHEISLHRGALPQASSLSLAEQLLGRLTSPSVAVVRAETQLRVQEALNAMDPVDREVLALRHFELLSNGEVAQVLGLSKAAASNRYVRALRRMKEVLSAVRAPFPRRSK
jgi:RNA polymerase sigma-70 factor (ECF subfamily)